MSSDASSMADLSDPSQLSDSDMTDASCGSESLITSQETYANTSNTTPTASCSNSPTQGTSASNVTQSLPNSSQETGGCSNATQNESLSTTGTHEGVSMLTQSAGYTSDMSDALYDTGSDDPHSNEFGDSDTTHLQSEAIAREEDPLSQDEFPADDVADDVFTHLTHIDKPETLAALLYLWATSSGVSAAALDRLLKLMKLLQPNSNLPSSEKSLKLLLQNSFTEDATMVDSFYVCYVCSDECIDGTHDRRCKVVVPSLRQQVEVILSSMMADILEYEAHMRDNPGCDVLCSRVARLEGLPMSHGSVRHLHLLLCADGTKYMKTSDTSFWPIQAQMLNLPPAARQKISQRILLAVIQCNKKPDFEKVLPLLFSRLQTEFLFGRQEIHIHATFFMADLPAMAQIFAIHQFNGSFGCPKCLHPGESLRVSERGHVRVFQEIPNSDFELRTNEVHMQYASVAENCGRPIFGVRRRAAILDYIKFPECNIPDPMHALFEGQCNSVIQAMTTIANRNTPCFLSENTVLRIDKLIESCQGPIDFAMPPPLSRQSLWKAKHYRNYFLFLTVTLLRATSNTQLKLFIASLSVLYGLLFHSRSSLEDITFLRTRVLDVLPNLFGVRIFRLNFHMLRHFLFLYEQYGPISVASMFGFESAIGRYQKLLMGTRNYACQMASKTLTCKRIYHALASSSSHSVQQALKLVSLDRTPGPGLYCTYADDKNRRTTNSFVLTKQKTIGMIVADSAEGVTLHQLDPIMSWKDACFNAEQMSQSEVEWLQALDTIVQHSEFMSFDIYDISILGPALTTSRDNFLAPCILVPVSSCGEHAYCIVPLYSYMHD